MNSVLSTGLSGIQAGQNSAQSAAQKIASATVTTPTDSEAVDAVNEAPQFSTRPANSGLDALTEGAVQLVRSEQQVQASAAVVRTADETLGTLIDTLA
ncbi:hypothetical protein [Dasania marina]|uniref:hypothetical protein n=1 Tax=Dasania marina TaxID=471499 RepID=UPI0030D92345|tara:strand:- start:47281 stop:47574 length:294 start_codon:yes stop_codon:yes gene_type:complete